MKEHLRPRRASEEAEERSGRSNTHPKKLGARQKSSEDRRKKSVRHQGRTEDPYRRIEAYYDGLGTTLEIMVPKLRVGPEEHEVRVCLRPHLGSNDLMLT
ncbi:unnamed protein product [Camellia sinensis]